MFFIHMSYRQVLPDEFDDRMSHVERFERSWWPFGKASSETTKATPSESAVSAVVEASVSGGGGVTNNNETSFDINIRLVQNNGSSSETAKSTLDDAFLLKSKKLLKLLEARITERVTDVIASKVRQHIAQLMRRANATKQEAKSRKRPSASEDEYQREHQWTLAPASAFASDDVAGTRQRRAHSPNVRRYARRGQRYSPRRQKKIGRRDYARRKSKIARGDKERHTREYKRLRRDGRIRDDDDEAEKDADYEKHRRTRYATQGGRRRDRFKHVNNARHLRRTSELDDQSVGRSKQKRESNKAKHTEEVEVRRRKRTHKVTKGNNHTGPRTHSVEHTRNVPHNKRQAAQRVSKRRRNVHSDSRPEKHVADDGISVAGLVNKIVKSHDNTGNIVRRGNVRTTSQVISTNATGKHRVTGLFWFYSKLNDKDASTVKFTEIFQATRDLKHKRKGPVETRESVNRSATTIADVATSKRSRVKKRKRFQKRPSHKSASKSHTKHLKPKLRTLEQTQRTSNNSTDGVDKAVKMHKGLKSHKGVKMHKSSKMHKGVKMQKGLKSHKGVTMHNNLKRQNGVKRQNIHRKTDSRTSAAESHDTNSQDLSKNVFYAHWQRQEADGKTHRQRSVGAESKNKFPKQQMCPCIRCFSS